MLYLYHNDMSVCAQKVRMVLAHKALDWEGSNLNLRAGEQFSPDFLRISPKGLVPVLLHDDEVILESNAIVQYLDEALKIPATKEAELRGKSYVVLFGKKRETRFIKDMTEALRRLEAVRQGLGYEHISIPLKVLDEQLRADELTDLVGKSYGNRSVKSTLVNPA